MSVTNFRPSTKTKCAGCGKIKGHVRGCAYIPCPKCHVPGVNGHLENCPENLAGESPADKVIRTTVDGQEAVIDGTAPKPEPLYKPKTRDELIDDLRAAFKVYDEAKAAHKITTDDLTEAKKLVESRARSIAETDADGAQMILGEDE